MERLLGVVHYALFPAAGSGTGDVTETFEPILRDGSFGAIEVTWIKDDHVRRKAASILSSADVQVMFSGGPPLLSSGLSLSSVNSVDRQRAVDFARQLVDMAYELGARNLLIASGPDPGGTLRQAAIAAFERSLEELCAHAITQRPHDPLVICVEPFDREVQWRQLLGPTRLSAAVISDIRKRFANCGITLDMSHVVQLGENLEGAIDAAGNCLVHAHIANCVLDRGNLLFGDMHPPFDVPGGEYHPEDMVRYLKALDSSGFFSRPCPYGKPVVSLEIRPAVGQDPVKLLGDCKAHLTDWLQVAYRRNM